MALIEHLLGCTPEPVAPASGCFFFVLFLFFCRCSWEAYILFDFSLEHKRSKTHEEVQIRSHTRTRMHE
jgi:hypothetical protein